MAALYPSARPGDHAVLRVHLSGLEARTPLLVDLAAALGLRPVLLHGGIEDVQGTPVGTLFLGLSAEPTGIISQAVAFLAARAQSAEVVGYVADSA
jgi:D-methionine transport system ATP-binding protein